MEPPRSCPNRLSPLRMLLVLSWLMAIPLMFFAIVSWIVTSRGQVDLLNLVMAAAGLALASQVLMTVVCLVMIVVLRPKAIVETERLEDARYPRIREATASEIPTLPGTPAVSPQPLVSTTPVEVVSRSPTAPHEKCTPVIEPVVPANAAFRNGPDVMETTGSPPSPQFETTTHTKVEEQLQGEVEIRASPEVLVDADSVIDQSLWKELEAYLRKYPHQEQGGFVLGSREMGQSRFLAVVFPKQISSTPTHCEFSTEDIFLIREALDEALGDEQEEVGVVTAWIHTHPNLSVFLSGTDKATLTKWFGLDRRARAAVVDVFKKNFNEQFAVFDSNFKRVSVQVVDVPLPRGFRQKFRAAVERTYQHNGRAVPFIATASESSGHL